MSDSYYFPEIYKIVSSLVLRTHFHLRATDLSPLSLHSAKFSSQNKLSQTLNMSQKSNTSSSRSHVAWTGDLPRPDRRQHPSPPLKRAASTDLDLEAERTRYRKARRHAHVTWASKLLHPSRRRNYSPPVQQAASFDRDLNFERARYSSASSQSSLGTRVVLAGSLRNTSVSSLAPTSKSSAKKGEEPKNKFGFRWRL